MKKIVVGVVVAILAVTGSATAAQASENGEGHAYGRVVQQCLSMSVGSAITAGRDAHPGVKMTAKTIATSPHCD